MLSQPRYANWISFRPILKGFAIAAFFLLLSAVAHAITGMPPVVALVLLAPAMPFLAFALYLLLCKVTLSYRGGKRQAAVLRDLLDRLAALPFQRDGKLLDIGCGGGALSIMAAQAYPQLTVTGVDYWGDNWYYSQAQCQRNAQAAGVGERVQFQKGDAAKLDFANGSFDMVVSNLVFHEVKTQPNKLRLVREALRVLRPGGVFVLQDVYFARSVYGDIALFTDALRADVHQIALTDLRHPRYAPFYLSTRFVIGNLGALHGIK